MRVIVRAPRVSLECELELQDSAIVGFAPIPQFVALLLQANGIVPQFIES
jgi:hypothetical protein